MVKIPSKPHLVVSFHIVFIYVHELSLYAVVLLCYVLLGYQIYAKGSLKNRSVCVCNNV